MKKILLLISMVLCVSTIYAEKGKKIETSYRNAIIFAYDRTNSVYEDDNIVVEIYNGALWISNKTKKTVFIDLSQCFLTHNGSSRPIFTKDQDEKKASRKGHTSSVEEFLTIAPATGTKQNATHICDLIGGVLGHYTTSETPWGDMTEYDTRFIELINELVVESQKADTKQEQCLGTVSRHLLEDESVNNVGASIAYAFNKRSEEWTNVSLSTWVCDVIFAPYYFTVPKDLKKKEKQGFGVKETKPLVINVKSDSPFEFDQDKSPIMLFDWKGNYKKGTFDIEVAGILKPEKGARLVAALTAMLSGGQVVLNVYENYYKSIIEFQGNDADWGKMSYAGKVDDAEQKIK